MEALAIVVGATNVGESSRIVRLLTAERGRVSVMVRSARASRKRFAGQLELGSIVEVVTSRGRGDLENLSEAKVREAPKQARQDLDRIALLAYGCELCAALAPEHSPAPKLFRLLATWLIHVETSDAVGEPARLALEAKALTFSGLTPALVHCALCTDPLTDPIRFDPEAGGALHEECGSGKSVTLSTLRRLEALRRTPMIEVTEPGVGLHRWLLSDFASHHLDRELRSRGLLEELTA